MSNFQLSPGLDSNKIFLVKHSELEGRLDPIYYSSNLQMFLTGKYASAKIRNFSVKIISGVGAGKQNQAKEAGGIIQIRPTNIDVSGELKYDKNIFLPSASRFEKININDVLFNNTNSQELVGKTSILKKRKELFFSNHITKITVNESKVIPDYLAILLNIYRKNKIFYSICTNWNNQSGIGLDLLKSLPIPVPPKEIQEQIVAKMDVAYSTKKQKEAEAQRLLDSIDDYLLGELGIVLPEQEKNTIHSRIFKKRLSEVSGGRLDAEYYQDRFIKQNEILKMGSYDVFDLGYLLMSVVSGSTPQAGGDGYEDNGKYHFIRLTNFNVDLEVVLSKTLFVKEAIHQGYLKRSQLGQGDVLFGIAGSIGKIAIYTHQTPANINQAIARLRFKECTNYLYAAYLLNSVLLTNQVDRNQRPMAQPNLNIAELKSLKIPLPPLKKQTEIADHITQIRNQAKQLKQQAKAELEQAKKAVEAMILGEDNNLQNNAKQTTATR